ncbi:hypothetical protein GCM10010405_16050 [Streptomyces macrosporus]|uniref:Uncharacterized protein n=1 Tax=Streptomyces macrosporus TaxID=44032 RepID=A0ABN3JPL9_9ACTN
MPRPVHDRKVKNRCAHAPPGHKHPWTRVEDRVEVFTVVPMPAPCRRVRRALPAAIPAPVAAHSRPPAAEARLSTRAAGSSPHVLATPEVVPP